MTPHGPTFLPRLLVAVLLLAVASSASAAPVLIAGTSFEEPTPAAEYVDTGDASTDHALVNNPGETPVNYTSVGGELGFASFYTNTRNDVGLTDGDFVGPTAFTADVGAFQDGSQGFEMQDADGLMTTTLDAVDLTGFTSPEVSIEVFVVDSGWETTGTADRLRVWVEVDGGVELDLLDTAGSDIDGLGIEGSWMLLTQSLVGFTTATLRFELDSNAATEAVYFDDIRFTGVPAAQDPVINELTPKGTEWVELYNPGASGVDVTGWYLDDTACGSGTSTIGAVTIASGAYHVVTAGGAGDNFALDNTGGFVVLCDDTDAEIDRVAFGTGGGAPIGPAAGGAPQYSVARVADGVDTGDDARDFNLDPSPTQGTANDPAAVDLGGSVLVNEIDVFPVSGGDMVELFNPTGAPLDLTGWSISDGDDVAFLAGMPAIGAGGFLALDEDSDWTSEGTTGVDFASTDVLYLFDAAGVRVDQLGWAGEFEDDCFARLPDGAGPNDGFDWPSSNGGTDLVDQACTLGATNGSAPTVALVINEVDYDQPATGDPAEFVEIYNAGGGTVDLSAYSLRLVNGNGGGAAVYGTFALSGMLAAGDYHVVCGDAANVPNCDLDVSPDGNLVQNGSPDATAIVETSSGTVVDTLSYEGDTGAPYTEGTGTAAADSNSTAFVGLSRTSDGADTGDNNADFSLRCITPGTANTTNSTSCPDPVPPPPAVAREIWQIQGDGLASPDDGAAVELMGDVVTAVGPEGFFLQTPAADSDGDPDTSDGIYVFTGGAPAVTVGDVVDLTGTVDEFFDLTEITSLTSLVVTSNNPGLVPAPFVLGTISYDPAMPTCSVAGGGNLAEATFECLEGMYVTASGVTSTPSQSFGTDPIAEAFIVPDSTRAFREPGLEFPGMPGIPVWDANIELLELDPDALGLPNVELTSDTPFTASGGLAFQFGGYELWPSALVTGAGMTLPQPVRPALPSEMTIGSFNMLRLFDEVDDPIVDDPTDVTAQEYDDHRAELARYVLEVLRAPDILGVQEVEKLTVLQDLAADIQAMDPSVVYTAYLEEGNDIGGIDVGFLVRDTVTVDSVTQLGAAETLSVDGSLLHDRPSLLLEGRFTANGADFPLAVMVNHNRSLGGIDDPGSNGDRVRQKRLEQAQSIAQKVDDYQDTHPTVPLILIGDFNAYQFSDGYVDVVGQIVGDVDPAAQILEGPDLVDPNLTIQTIAAVPVEERYSFIFNGSAQALDHALTSTVADVFVRGMEYGRGNIDAPELYFGDPSTPLASSDHDGFVLFLMTDQDADGIPDDLDNCPMVANPAQTNSDGDTLGDVCDNCPLTTNQDQTDGDLDGLGDSCDNCITVGNADQSNSDGDTLGDACDNCPLVTNEDQQDTDLDGIGDACDVCDPLDPPVIEVLDQNETQVTLRIADCDGVSDVALGPDAANITLTFLDGMLGDPVVTVLIEVADPGLDAVASIVAEDDDANRVPFVLFLGASLIIAIPTIGEVGMLALVVLLALAGRGTLRRRRV